MRKVVSIVFAVVVVAGCGSGAPAVPTATAAAPTGTPAAQTPPSSPTASAAALRDFPDGRITPGRYSFLHGAGSFDVPAGWEGCCDGFGVLRNDFAAVLVDDLTNVIVYADSCHWKAGPNPEPKGAQAIAAAFAAQIGHQGTAPQKVTVGGLPAWRVTLTVPANQATTGGSDNFQFTGCDEGQFAAWTVKPGTAGPSRYQQAPSQIDTLHIVDVKDRTFVLDVATGPSTTADEKAALDAMLASVTFP